ncbi:MAG: permease [Blastocatellia bacterium]|nr:MAG: permease [Blastocatellia bacterium]
MVIENKTPAMNDLLKDIRYGIRILLKNPAVSFVAVMTLALGIGVNTAIFSGVNAFLMKPLPVLESERLIRPAEVTDERGRSDEFSYPDFVEYRQQLTTVEGISAEDMAQAALDADGVNEVVWGQVVSGNYFDVLRVTPIKGRTFAPDEDKAVGASPVVVLSCSLWKRRFGADEQIVGKKVQLNSRTYDVIGIAPESFKGTKFGLALDFWAPISMAEDLDRSPNLLRDRDSHWMNVIGRLKPGVTREQVQAEMSAIATQLNQTYPNERAKTTRAVVQSELEGRWDEATPVLRSAGGIAMAIVGLILLIACANVANLLLARAAVRRKEIGIRLALGASRLRLMRQLLTESLILSFLGGALGLVLAQWVTRLMETFIPVLPYNIVENFFALDSRALVFTAVVAIATAFVFGLAPAWHSSNPEVLPILKAESNSLMSRRARRLTLRSALAIAQISLSLVVLVCGGLFVKSFRQAQTMDPGFDSKNELLVSLNPQLIGYDDAQTKTFYSQILQRASAMPGVEAAGLARLIPLSDSSNSNGPILKEGETLARGSSGRNIMTNVISPGYFRALQIPIVQGRDFDERDRQGGQRVVIVNQYMAEMLWPGEDAVGKHIFIGAESRDPLEVVGVAKTGKYRALAEDPKPFFYYPLDQRRPSGMTLILHTNGDPRGLVAAIRNQVQSLDRRIPLYTIRTMPEHMTWALWAPNMAATLSLAFGLVAILMCSVGLYSVMAYIVSQRTREVGIRMALGANRRDVLKLITNQGLRLAAFGLLVGLLLSLALARLLSNVLIGISGYDVTAFVLASCLLMFVTVIASYLPARRATRVDPLVALRDF